METIDRLLKLAALASSPNENEAQLAASQVCTVLREQRELLFGELTTRHDYGIFIPAKPSATSTIHETAALYMEWRAFKKRHYLEETSASEVEFCASCGERINEGDAVTRRKKIASTHTACAGWWWNYEFPPEDDIDIPFLLSHG
ncbi:MAG TPA: hypothetical protein VFP84_05095 [Kofleriaceae bacterium]|nr:hypothetical protein [Kofleriaceae bacterium]